MGKIRFYQHALNTVLTESAISVTKAAQNLADVVKRAYYRHETTTLLKVAKPVARIVPACSSVRDGKEIAAKLTSNRPRLGVKEAEAVASDLLEARTCHAG